MYKYKTVCDFRENKTLAKLHDEISNRLFSEQAKPWKLFDLQMVVREEVWHLERALMESFANVARRAGMLDEGN